jgi:fumarate hydratase class II
VFGHDAAIGFAASQGHFELNVYKPLIAHDALDSLRLLGDAMHSFASHCVDGIVVNAERVDALLKGSLMLVTALAPHVGYDAAAKIAKHAHARKLSLREAALELGTVTGAQFDAWVDPTKMLGPSASE